MKSICVDARMLGTGGIGTYLYNLLDQFKTSPFKFYALIHRHHVSLISQWKHIEPIVIDFPIYSIAEQCQLPLKIPACDLFWSPHYNIPLLPIRAHRRLTTIHDVFHLAFFSSLKLLEKLYSKVVMEAAVRLADAVITVSQFSKSELQKHTSIVEKKIQVIYSGLNQAVFCDEKKDSNFKLPKEFILFVGNIKPHKNVKAVIQALDLLAQEDKQIDLVIIGKSEGLKTKEDLIFLGCRYAHLKDRLHVLSDVSERHLVQAYRLARALVLPSFYEGFGFPPLEAMGAGCPTIVSSRGSLPEVCQMASIYIDPHAPQEIACALKRVLEDQSLRETLIRSGFEQVQKFSWAECADRHLKLIDQLVH